MAGVWYRAGRAAYGYLPAWQTMSLEQAREAFRRDILAYNELWVGTTDGRVVAYFAMQGSVIDRLYVDPAEQRQGWATRLIKHAKRLSPQGLELYTHQENAAARALYEKHGFIAVKFGVSPPPESALDVEYHWRPGKSR